MRNNFLAGAKYCEEFGSIEKHLQKAIDAQWANERSYNIALDSVGRRINFQAATRIFEKAIANFMADRVTYGTYIRMRLRLGFWATALEILDQTKAAKCESPAAYNNLLLHTPMKDIFQMHSRGLPLPVSEKLQMSRPIRFLFELLGISAIF